MNETVRTVTLVLVIVGGLGSVGVVGSASAAPADSGSQAQTGESTPSPTQTNATQTNATQTNATQTNATQGPFRLTVKRVEKCGLTCRNITVGVTNVGNRTLENITVESDILAGNETIIQRRTQVGTLAPNESVNRTVEVSVGFSAVSKIRQARGNITIRTQVTSADYNETFVEQRTLASFSG